MFKRIINNNFSSQDGFAWEDRLFDDIEIPDQFSVTHYLPKFISKIANADQNVLNFDDKGLPVRGVRTFGEIAHYVRCLPFEPRESFGLLNVWCSPDFTLKRKIGNEFDHALLMASLFRTSKHETSKDFNKWCLQMRKEKKSKQLEQLDKF